MTKWLSIVLFVSQLTLAQKDSVMFKGTVLNAYRFLVGLMIVAPTTISFGQIITITTESYSSTIDRTPPSVPRNLVLEVISTTEIKLTWTDSPEGDLAKIQIRKNNVLVDSVNPGVQEYSATGLTASTHYYFDIRARDDSSNWSAYTDTIGAMTANEDGEDVPGVPLNFVIADSIDGIDLSWTANLPSATAYVIRRNGVDYDTTASTTWTDSDTVDGNYHSYRVYGYNLEGDGDTTATLTTERVSNNTYYVSSGGNNSNSGTNPNLAWATLSKVNSAWLEGMGVYFKKDESFNGSLVIQNDNVVLASYGTGAKPKITNVYDLPGWTNSGNWTQSGNIWEIAMTGERIYRLWINGTEVYQASWDNDLGEYFGNGSHLFLHSTDENKFWVYSTSNPSTAFASMQIAGYKVGGVDKFHTVEINGDYVTVKELDIQNGLYSSLTGNRHNANIQDCNIGYNTNKHGICLQRSTLTQGNNWTLKRDSIFSNWIYDYEMYDVSTPYGIYTKGDNWTIDSCYIKDWWFGIYSAGNTNTISNNEISSPNWNFTKGIQIYPRSTAYWWQRNVVYNNFIHNVKAVGMSINSSGNKIYFNIIDSVLCSTLEEKDASSPGCSNTGNAFEFTNDGDLGTSQIDSNYIFNNTVYYTDRAAYFSTSSPRYTTFYNNLMVNTRRHFNTPNLQAMEVMGNTEISTGLFKNNIHYNSGSSSSIYFISGTSSPYTVAGLNSAYPSNAIGNFYSSESSVADLITVNTWILPSGSEGLNAGISIESLIGSGFIDRLGNEVDRANPNIGAIDNTP